MGGSPMMLKYTASRSGAAFANWIWCASVVLPPPGPPAIRLKENSGIPPPKTSSRPGTPDGNLRIGTASLICLSPRCGLFDRRPRAAQRLGRQSISDESGNQREEGSKQGRGRLRGDGGLLRGVDCSRITAFTRPRRWRRSVAIVVARSWGGVRFGAGLATRRRHAGWGLAIAAPSVW